MLNPEIARRLFQVYRQALPNANIKVEWHELPPEIKEAWMDVATEAVHLLTSSKETTT